MKNRQQILKQSINNQEIIVEKSMTNLQQIVKHLQKWIRKLQTASMMHQLRRSFGFGWAHQQIILMLSDAFFLNSMVHRRCRRPDEELAYG